MAKGIPPRLPSDITAEERLRPIVTRLLRWFSRHGRTFPWRESSDPYVTLVSEILLKQTASATAAALLPGFLSQYPTPRHLAAANHDELREILRPLGLYEQRAKHLGKIGEALREYEWRIDPKRVQELPGVGPYTALAVRCFAFGEAVGPVDTNFTRVLGRVFDLSPSRSEERKSPEYWAIAAALVAVRPKKARELNWAIIDLADSTCLIRDPKCPQCPIKAYCQHGQQEGPA